jgi:hypothetical protein
MDLDPIRQLQSLLEDRGKVPEKISSIQTAIGSLPPTDLPESKSPTSAGPQPSTAIPINVERGYGRLLDLVRDMKSQIEERVRPIVEQVVELEVAQIRERSGNDQATLDRCLAQIDQCLLRCAEQIDEYQKKQAHLFSLNDRLAALGEPPEPIAESLRNQDLTDILRSRVEELRRQGKL